MRAAIRVVIMLAVALIAVVAVQAAASAATAIEYGLIAGLIAVA
ncbi:hypothetical protein [Nonomuraea zeae]|nr:hypothetical protein [Nonomuraea zeae]